MVAIEAVQAAKTYILEIFEDEQIVEVGLEELEYRDKDPGVWKVTIGFRRRWQTTPLVTVDLELYLAASATDPSSAVNYRHLQERYVHST